MTAPCGPIVLILREAGLRSILAARFGMAGEAVVTGTFDETTAGSKIRQASVIVIDEATIRGPPILWPEPISTVLPLSRTIIIVAEAQPNEDQDALVLRDMSLAEIVDPDDAVSVVLDRLSKWRAESAVR